MLTPPPVGSTPMTTYVTPPVFERQATVGRVVDGDTLHLAVDLGCDVDLAMTVRLYGLNTPELPTPEGVAAKAFVTEWVTEHGPVFALRTVKDRKEKYGRYLADLVPLDLTPEPDSRTYPTSLCTALLDAGHAVPYLI